MRRANVLSVDCDYDATDPDGFRSGSANMSQAVGPEALAAKVCELPAGESRCPYHYEYEEGWLLILDGTVFVRKPDDEEEIVRGDVVCFPRGPSGAHKVTNRSTAAARILMFSSAREPAVAVYPDSARIGVWSGNPDDTVMLRRVDGNVTTGTASASGQVTLNCPVGKTQATVRTPSILLTRTHRVVRRQGRSP